MITIGSKSSASYLRPVYKTGWLMLPFVRRQSMSIERQYTVYGIRFFDISVRTDRDKRTLISCDGVTMTTFSVYEMFSFMNQRGNCTVHLTLDEKGYTPEAENRFYVYCANAEMMFPNVNFCGGYVTDRPEEPVYRFSYEKSRPRPVCYISALPAGAGFWRRLFHRVCPRIHAYIYNKRTIAAHAEENGVLLLDYVQYQ